MSSNDIALRVENVSKCYHIYKERHHRLLQSLWGARRKYYREFWALQEVSFDIRKGECVGILGRNGSGKSTLLQIVVGTLRTTKGAAITNGRVAALLELGSGFNPEFTGRDNVYLNGLILGLTEKEIDVKYDRITAFADIGDFIDQPTKTYSSGMVVRLAFAVQVMLEPDILIVDEALSVGDAAFQMKCMSHMKQLMEKGTTVLLVSHSVQTIRSICQRAIWLDKGRIRDIGATAEVTSQYMEFLFSGDTTSPEADKNVTKDEAPDDKDAELISLNYPGRKDPLRRWGEGHVAITRFAMVGAKSGFTPLYSRLEPITVTFELNILETIPADGISFAFSIRDIRGIDIIAVSSAERNQLYTDIDAGKTVRVTFCFDNILNPGEYMLILAVEYFEERKRVYCDYIENAYLFQVASGQRHHGLVEPKVSIEFGSASDSD